MDRDPTPLGTLAVSPRSRRVIEASIAAGTGGPGFVVIQITLTGLACLLLIASLGTAVFAVGSAIAGNGGAWPLAGLALLFALPFVLFLAIQIPFLLRLRRGE